MPFDVLVTSKSNLWICDYLEDGLTFGPFNKKIIVSESPKKKLKPLYDDVVCVGGGSVIDTAKMLTKKSCIAYPTTASGAACTSHAVYWGNKKMDVKTVMPVCCPLPGDIDLRLPKKVLRATVYDCLSHFIEAVNSVNSNQDSFYYCTRGIQIFGRYLVTKDVHDLIEVGNCFGQAIEITGTNYFHALSYVLSIDSGLKHGDALREVLKGNFDGSVFKKAVKLYPKIKDNNFSGLVL